MIDRAFRQIGAERRPRAPGRRTSFHALIDPYIAAEINVIGMRWVNDDGVARNIEGRLRQSSTHPVADARIEIPDMINVAAAERDVDLAGSRVLDGDGHDAAAGKIGARQESARPIASALIETVYRGCRGSICSRR